MKRAISPDVGGIHPLVLRVHAQPGTPEPEMRQAMGAPAGEYDLPDGTRQLVFPRGPLGTETYMVYVKGGSVTRSEQVLTDDTFYRVQTGTTTQEELRRMIGPPYRMVRFDNLRQVAWDYRFRDSWGYLADFSAMIDEPWNRGGQTHHALQLLARRRVDGPLARGGPGARCASNGRGGHRAHGVSRTVSAQSCRSKGGKKVSPSTCDSDFGEVDAVGGGECRRVDLRSTDDEHLGSVACRAVGLLEGRHDPYSRRLESQRLRSRTIFSRPGNGFADRLEGLAPHDDRVTHREPLEEREVGRKAPGQPVGAADHAVASRRRRTNERNHARLTPRSGRGSRAPARSPRA
jgi:hypothetical protein